MFQRLVTLSLEADRETTAYYRDVYDHIIRQYETVDSLRDLLTGAMDVYLSTVSNRLNMTVKALTVVASLFLPLTFLTGFFGMNFGWLVIADRHRSSLRDRPDADGDRDHHAAGVLPPSRLDLTASRVDARRRGRTCCDPRRCDGVATSQERQRRPVDEVAGKHHHLPIARSRSAGGMMPRAGTQPM